MKARGFVWFHFLLISFSSFLTPKSVLVWLFSFRLERTLAFSKRGFEGFESPFVLALEGFEAFEGFEGGFEAFVLTFEAFEGFLPFGAPPRPAPRPLRPKTKSGTKQAKNNTLTPND